MSKNLVLNRGDVLPASFIAALEEYVSTLASNFALTYSPTQVTILAGTGSAQVSLGIGGLWRYRTTTLNVAAPSGAAGSYDILAVASANSFASTPAPDTDNTDYSFGLQIVASGGAASGTWNGNAIVASRKVGSLVWSGSAITALYSSVGQASAPAVMGAGTGAGLRWGQTASSAADAFLYRPTGVTAFLMTDTDLGSAQNFWARDSTAQQVGIGNLGPSGQASVGFGASVDTNLYRAAAGALKTDGGFDATGYKVAGTALASTHLSDTALLARLAGPTFTGVPAAPTAAPDTNTTQLATTAYVVGQGYLKSATAGTTYQPLDGDLTAVAGLATTGSVHRTAANTMTTRTLTGTGGQVTVTNGDGVSGNPTVSLPASITQATTFMLALTGNGGYLIGTPLAGTPAYQAQQVAAQTVLRNKLLAADANDAFHVLGDGKHEWGLGGATAIDTNMYRAAAAILATDSTFRVNSSLPLDLVPRGSTPDAADFRFGDGTGYRLNFAARSGVSAGLRAFSVYDSGKLEWATDTNLYRIAAGALKTDSGLTVSGSGTGGSGQGLEMGTSGGVAYFQAFDRTASSAIPMHLQGSEVSLYDAAAHQRIKIDGTGLAFFGGATVAQQGATADLRTALVNYGLLVGGGATPLNLNGGALTASSITGTAVSASTSLLSTSGASFGGSFAPGSGQSVEVGYTGGVGFVQAYDRAGAGAFAALQLKGLSVKLQAGSTDRVTIDGTGVGFFGHATSGKRGTFDLTTGGNFTRTLAWTPTLQALADFVRQLVADLGNNGYGLLDTTGGA